MTSLGGRRGTPDSNWANSDDDYEELEDTVTNDSAGKKRGAKRRRGGVKQRKNDKRAKGKRDEALKRSAMTKLRQQKRLLRRQLKATSLYQ